MCGGAALAECWPVCCALVTGAGGPVVAESEPAARLPAGPRGVRPLGRSHQLHLAGAGILHHYHQRHDLRLRRPLRGSLRCGNGTAIALLETSARVPPKERLREFRQRREEDNPSVAAGKAEARRTVGDVDVLVVLLLMSSALPFAPDTLPRTVMCEQARF